MNEMFYFFLLFYNDLDLNNQKILWLPSIFQFERTVHNLNHPIDQGRRKHSKFGWANGKYKIKT